MSDIHESIIRANANGHDLTKNDLDNLRDAYPNIAPVFDMLEDFMELDALHDEKLTKLERDHEDQTDELKDSIKHELEFAESLNEELTRLPD